MVHGVGIRHTQISRGRRDISNGPNYETAMNMDIWRGSMQAVKHFDDDGGLVMMFMGWKDVQKKMVSVASLHMVVKLGLERYEDHLSL